MKYSKLVPLLIFITDFVLLNIAVNLARLFVFNYYSSQIQSNNFILIINLIWISIASLTKTHIINRPLILGDNVNKFSTSLLYHLAVVLAVIYFFKLDEVSRLEMLFFYVLFFIFIVIERSFVFFTLDYIRKKGYNKKHILLIGNQGIVNRLINSFAKHPEYGYNFIDFINEVTIKNTPIETLLQQILHKKPDEIFICYKYMNQDLLKTLINFGDQNRIKINVVSDLVLDNSFASIINYENIPIIRLSSHPEIGHRIIILKRGFDILFSAVIMILGLPLFILLILITKLTSKGPVFFKQERIGKDHRPFNIYKFRSMRVNAELSTPQLSSARDPRITKWGVIIRKSRLDELPQFWNVLKGDMSVVGPRPERQYFIEQLILKSPNYKKLFKLKPGLTSIGQVEYGYAENVDQMRNRIRYDLIYLNNINFNSDISIILKTIKVMVQLKGL
ncbi:sugar transferase [Mucilaginibacter sp.]